MSAIEQISLIPAAAPQLEAAPARRARTIVWALWPARTNRWTRWHAAGASVMAALAVLASLDAWRDIYHLAINHGKMDEEYSHIFLVPIVAAWMVWVRRHRIRYCKPSGTSLGLAMAVVGWAMTSGGFYLGKELLMHGGAVLLVIGCAMSVLGKHMLFRFFPAVAVLVFLIPVPGHVRQQIAVPLEVWTARLSQLAFDLMGVPVERHANLLSLNNQPVNIAEACNGLRMMFALVLITYAFCFGMPLRNGVRIFLLAVSPIATIFCNVLRILPTTWIYGYHGKDVGDVFHKYSGWLMLPISFLILLAVIRILRWAMIPVMRFTLAS